MEIREKIIQYLEYKGVSKYQFYKKVGISNGFLDKSGAIGSDNCEKICSHYEDLSIEWLILGTGSMLRNGVENAPSVQVDCSKCADYVDKIRDLQYIIDVQHQLIDELKLKGEDCQLGAGNAAVADVG